MAKFLDKKPKNITGALHLGIRNHRETIKPLLQKQQEILAEYANGWFTNEPRTRRPLNMVARAINLLVPLLASRNPRAMVRARILPLKPYADILRLTLNHLSDKIQFGSTLRTAIVNALTYMGTIKTGICAGGNKIPDAYGILHDAGQIFSDVIFPEDYFWDVSARKWEECDYKGNWFYVPFEYIQESGLYKNYDKLAKAYIEWDRYGAKKLSSRPGLKIDTIKPYVRIAEVWIPSEQIVVTIPAEGEGSEELRAAEYSGPTEGPYDELNFSTYPESLISIPPLYTNLDLHYLINAMARKMARQANREKKILAYQGTAEKDAESIVLASDGQSVRVDDINAIKEVEYGGSADASYDWTNWLMNLWSEQLQNANLLAGIRTQAPTLGQEQMLQANASAALDDMIQTVHDVSRSVMKKMAWYIFTDPLLDVSVSKKVGGLEEIPIRVTPETRQGDFWDYNFDIEPYSMQRMNPYMRLQRIMQIVTGVILPTLPFASQQGDMLQVIKLVKCLARDLDLTESEIDDFYKNTINPPNTNLGPYSPLQGQIAPQASDQQGASLANREQNLLRQENEDLQTQIKTDETTQRTERPRQGARLGGK